MEINGNETKQNITQECDVFWILAAKNEHQNYLQNMTNLTVNWWKCKS